MSISTSEHDVLILDDEFVAMRAEVAANIVRSVCDSQNILKISEEIGVPVYVMSITLKRKQLFMTFRLPTECDELLVLCQAEEKFRILAIEAARRKID